MSSYVLDTSVAVAWYMPDDISNVAIEWQDRLLAGEIALVAPTLHYWEFANVLRTYLKRGELHQDLASEIYALHQEAPLSVGEPTRGGLLDVALEYQCTAYDAVFISLCLERGVPILTAEKTTTPWVVKLGQNAVSLRA